MGSIITWYRITLTSVHNPGHTASPENRRRLSACVNSDKCEASGRGLDNQRIVQFCRRFGKFRPRFIAIDQPASLAEGLAISANEGAVSLHPIFISHLGIPNVVMVPIADKEATWDLFVMWQRGKTSVPLRALLDSLQLKHPLKSCPTWQYKLWERPRQQHVAAARFGQGGPARALAQAFYGGRSASGSPRRKHGWTRGRPDEAELAGLRLATRADAGSSVVAAGRMQLGRGEAEVIECAQRSIPPTSSGGQARLYRRRLATRRDVRNQSLLSIYSDLCLRWASQRWRQEAQSAPDGWAREGFWPPG